MIIGKPVDCTCHGQHSNDAAISTERLTLLIEQEKAFGTCPAEVRALVRILDRRST